MDYNLNLLLQPDEPDQNPETKNKERLRLRLHYDLKDQFFCSIADGNMEEFNKMLHIFLVTRMKLTEPWFTESRTGKTCLMKALLNLNDNTKEIVTKLITIAEINDCLEPLINAEFLDKVYKGQTALHIAIERRCPDIVLLLLEKGANVNAKANGKFFRPNRKRNGFYIGALPLALAACTNQPEMVTLLMGNQRMKVNEQDSEGNTVLHALVTVADDTEDNTTFVTEMYTTILIESKDSNLEEIKNEEGLTPLQLAATLGKFEIFRNILRREMKDKQHRELSRKITDWAYGPISSSLYNIMGVDTFEKDSVLKIVVFNSKIQNRHMLLSAEPLNTLLEQKWGKFAGCMFTASCFLYMAYVITFTAAYYNRAPVTESPSPMNVTTMPWEFRGRIFILLWAGGLFIIEMMMIRRLRLSDLQSLMTDAWFHILFFFQAVLVLVAAILRWVGADLYVAVLAVALAQGWLNILYYTRGFQSMGIYCVMLQKILVTDVLQFLSVYLLFLIGFGTALASLIQKCSDERTCSPYESFNTAVLELFKLTIGMGDLEIQRHAEYPQLFLILLVAYVVLTFILLLNMLIALMGETVEHISKESKNIWKLQRARTILNLEQCLPWYLRERFQLGKELNGKRYIRIDEVNWTKWNTRVARINEDPGEEEQEDSVDESSSATDTTSPLSRKLFHSKATRMWGRRKEILGSRRRRCERGQVLETVDCKETDSKVRPSEDMMI